MWGVQAEKGMNAGDKGQGERGIMEVQRGEESEGVKRLISTHLPRHYTHTHTNAQSAFHFEPRTTHTFVH